MYCIDTVLDIINSLELRVALWDGLAVAQPPDGPVPLRRVGLAAEEDALTGQRHSELWVLHEPRADRPLLSKTRRLAVAWLQPQGGAGVEETQEQEWQPHVSGTN